MKNVHNYQSYFKNNTNFSNYIFYMGPDIMYQVKNRYKNTVFFHMNKHYTLEICKSYVLKNETFFINICI